MSINTKQLDELLSYNSSWALWPEKKESFTENCKYVTSYIYDNHYMLKANIVLLAYNRSGSKKPEIKPRKDFCNFHSLKRNGDKRLERNIMSLNNLRGAYMADLNNEIVCSKPKGISIEQHNFDILIKQLDILNPEDKKFIIVCFGSATFTNLVKFLPNLNELEEIDPKMLCVTQKCGNYELKIFQMYHYSSPDRGYMIEREDVLKKQFKYINDHLYES